MAVSYEETGGFSNLSVLWDGYRQNILERTKRANDFYLAENHVAKAKELEQKPDT